MSARLRFFVALVFCVGLAASYGLAQLGEPQSVWLWRDMLGVLQ